MGEAKRRGGKPPTATQKVRRWANGRWLVYPRPIRTFYKWNVKMVVGAAAVMVGLLIMALIVKAGEWLVHH